MTRRIKVETMDVDWTPAEEVWSGYRPDGLPPEADPLAHGIFLKILRRPEDGGGCWCAVLRFAPPPGYAIRVTATADSDEEILMLGKEHGTFVCNPAGLRHGNTLVEETTAFVHYHAAPDNIIRTEVIPLSSLSGAP